MLGFDEFEDEADAVVGGEGGGVVAQADIFFDWELAMTDPLLQCPFITHTFLLVVIHQTADDVDLAGVKGFDVVGAVRSQVDEVTLRLVVQVEVGFVTDLKSPVLSA